MTDIEMTIEHISKNFPQNDEYATIVINSNASFVEFKLYRGDAWWIEDSILVVRKMDRRWYFPTTNIEWCIIPRKQKIGESTVDDARVSDDTAIL